MRSDSHSRTDGLRHATDHAGPRRARPPVRSWVAGIRGLGVALGATCLLMVTTAAQAQMAASPSISVDKTVYAGHDAGGGCPGGELLEGAPGGEVTYCFEVTNDGDTPLEAVTVADADLDIDDSDMTTLPGEADLALLAPGESVTLYVEGTVTGDLTNTATVAAVPVDGNGDPLVGVDPVTAEDTAQVDELAPSVSVAKTVYRGHDDGAGCPGTESVSGDPDDAVTYCFHVTNDGEATLSPVTLADADLGIDDGDMAMLSGDLSMMEPGATASLYVEASIAGDLTNTASVTGHPVDAAGDTLAGSQPVTESDQARVDQVGPSISLEKSVYLDHDDGVGCPGSEVAAGADNRDVTYCFVVTNDGDTILGPVTVTDGDLGIDESDMTLLSGDLTSLAPGDSVSLHYQTVIDGDLTNTATASGTPSQDDGEPLPGLDPVTDEDTARVDEVAPTVSLLTEVLDPFTGIYLDADADAGTLGDNDDTPATVAAGDSATFRFTAANEGDAAITDVEVDAPLCDAPPSVIGGDGGEPDVLDEEETWVLTCDIEDVVEGMTMKATLTGDANGDEPDGSGTSETARVQVAALSIEKSVQNPRTGEFGESVVLEPGADVTFQILVTNAGEVPLAGAVVNDPLASQCDHDATGVLAPGEDLAPFTCVVEDVREGFVNTATVSARPVDARGEEIGDEIVAESLAVVDMAAAFETTDLALTKILAETDQTDGTATWLISVTNEGAATATEPIVVTDELPAGLSYRDAGGDGWTCEHDAPVVTCATDLDVGPGQSASIAIETYVLADPGEIVTNEASVDGSGDLDSSNNTDVASVQVDSEGNLVPVVPTSSEPTDLARTGSDVARLVALASVLLLLGVLLLRAARRATVSP